MVGFLSPVIFSASAGVQNDASVMDGANTLLYQGQVGSPHAMWHLVDRRISVIVPGRRPLASVEPTPS
jgi:hypothetical protein